MARQSWDEYHMNAAKQAATRSTCDRAHVGCVIVHDNHIISTGYNGSISGHEHCDDAGHMIVNDHCIRAAHSENNAVAFAAKKGISLAGSIAYITHFPCWPCFRLLAQAGIEEIVYLEMKINKMTKAVLNEICKSKIGLRSLDKDFRENYLDTYNSLPE